MRLNDLGAVSFLRRIQIPLGLIPFALTFSRIAVAPALYALVSVDSPFALPVIATSVLTDVLDGFLARRLGVVTN